MSLNFTIDESTSVQVMAWCRQATRHYLSQCWPRSLLPYGVTRPQSYLLLCEQVREPAPTRKSPHSPSWKFAYTGCGCWRRNRRNFYTHCELNSDWQESCQQAITWLADADSELRGDQPRNSRTCKQQKCGWWVCWCQPAQVSHPWSNLHPGHRCSLHLQGGKDYHQISNISCTLVGNKIADHSDVLGASPVGATPTTSSFSP